MLFSCLFTFVCVSWLLLCDLLLSFTWLADAAMAAADIDVLRIWLVLMQQGKRGRAVSLLQYSKTISAPKASITFGHRSTYGMVLNTVSINVVFIRPLGWSQDLGHLKRSRIPANDEMATLEVVGFGLWKKLHCILAPQPLLSSAKNLFQKRQKGGKRNKSKKNSCLEN